MNEPIRFNRSNLSRNIAYVAIHVFAFFLLYQLSDFITPFLGALIFYVLFTPFMQKLTMAYKWRKEWAALCIGALRERVREPWFGDPDIPQADRTGWACTRNAPRDAAVLHDHS